MTLLLHVPKEKVLLLELALLIVLAVLSSLVFIELLRAAATEDRIVVVLQPGRDGGGHDRSERMSYADEMFIRERDDTSGLPFP